MSSSAGLAASAKRSRIKKRAVRPPVAGRPVAGESKPETEEEAEVKQQEAATIEPSEVEASAEPQPESLESEAAPTEEPSPEKAKSKKKKKAVVKKIGHTQPRFEVRLNGDHEKLVEDIQRKAFREALAANKGINNSELFGGFLEFIRPFRKDISFSSLDFKRGKLYGDGTERIKVEIGKSFERASLEYFLSAIESGENGVVSELFQSMAPDRRDKIIAQIMALSEQLQDERLAANS